ncbi:MAG: TolC family protein [Bacteroidales bacterium]
MNRRVYIVLFLLILFFKFDCLSQQLISIEESIEIAKKNSLEIQEIKNKYNIVAYEYQIFNKSFYPTFDVSGNFPAFNRSISKIILPNGDEAFVSQSTGSYSGKISINQPLPFWGSNLILSSGIQRLDLYNDKMTTSYLSNIINIGINQSIFKYNTYKWSRKIEPIKFFEARQEYIEGIENISRKVVELYFNLLESQAKIDIQIIKKMNMDSLFYIANGRYSVGKCTEDEVMQIEVNILNVELQISNLINERDKNKQLLCDFLQLKDTNIILVEPSLFYLPNINIDKAISEAMSNSSFEYNQRRKLLEGESNLAKIKSENKPSVDLYATLGLSKNDPSFKGTFQNPLNQEVVTLSFNVPIYDFGIRKKRIKQAELSLSNTIIDNEKEKQNKEIALIEIVSRINILDNNLIVVRKTQELSEKRLKMSKSRYENGKIGFLEYSNALEELNNAKINYLNLLSEKWNLYYSLRKLTLYDFKENRSLVENYPQ